MSPTNSSRKWAFASGATATAIPACTIRSIPTIRRSPAISKKWSPPTASARAKAILDENRHNTVYFPNFTVKGPIQLDPPVQADRARPHAAESWTFRLVDAPDMLLERTLIYNRLINAPTSIVGHDDLEMYERAQEGLHVDANPWVNIQRLYDPAEAEQETAVINGTSEWQMRNQFRAWSKFMTMSMTVLWR
jgi:benzoate/toluate 1,2-dioxygenase alpha subunit